ncbi:hypothetical protein [Ferrimonas sp.]|uniref:hypothetical protein n=1 Tax=Ferrimonas sp. TaxID=2080861 RepID=UPI003A93B762
MRIETANHIQGALRAKGFTCRAWAMQHGYNPRTVLHCIQLFAPENNRKPKRKLSKSIISDLSQTLGFDLFGGTHE